MNKRCQPTRLIIKPSLKSKSKSHHSSSQLDINQTVQELTDLKTKVQQSKPILESIYDKVKRKEEKYQS